MNMRKTSSIASQVVMAALILTIFVIPLIFVVFIAGMETNEAALQPFKLPAKPQYLVNFVEVFSAGDRMLGRAFRNSFLITGVSIPILVVVSAMAAFVLERRKSRMSDVFTSVILAGLMIPPSVVTTIWLLQRLSLYKTLPGIILIEVALGFPFAMILFRGFMVTLPKELDEATYIEGASTWHLFWKIIFPLLKPVTFSVLVLSSVNIFNDFVNPLYFLPGAKNVTVQLTLYNFMSRYSTQYNLLFMNILIISIPPLIVFIIFNKKIIGGMVAGAVKG